LGAWHGLVVNGVLARSVRDTAFFYDASPTARRIRTRTRSRRARSWTRSAGQALKIALSMKLPPSPLRSCIREQAALDETWRC